MAIKDGLPATDFSRMNREYIRNVAEGETVKDGLPATDFSRMNREYIKAVVEEAGGGGGGITVEELTITENDTYTAPEGKAYSPVIVNVSGGGDESPIQMATVTLNIGQGKKAVEFNALLPYPEENPNTSNLLQYYATFVVGDTESISPETLPDLDSTITVYLPMYNEIGYIPGVFSAYLADSTIFSESVSLSGNAEMDANPDNGIKVTGDCAITITWGS